MSNVRQISVFIDNKPNQLAGVMRMMKESKINARALTVADTKDFGILRMIVNDTDKAVEKLKAASFAVAVTEIVAISIPDSPGQLSRVLDILGSRNVNIEYLYTFLGKSDRSVSFVIRVDDNENASEALTDGGIIQLTENDIAEM
ncbi:MAG: amino acid-binding protein [Ruminococcus sp.]|uniref:amino acid-binding protein n=1 Tax=Ruminococcus sp. TaxID=41978 RepID=UPI001B0C77BF|nr:amino acid-binding protein [Ruminococcus sp.]MBO7473780.1 amino acid-binding protein [Ruminococcus sp.]MBP5433180.1 amino acid-binding protein [Ruminococcus sp.]